MAGIYIHIPFCTKRCIYCGFFSTTDKSYTERYINAVCKELAIRSNYLQGNTIRTIYFGGGTPSLLKKEQFEKVFNTLNEHYNLSETEEITIECNPDDLSEDYIEGLKQMPFNRISIGIQSFDDSILSFIKRRHNSDQAVAAVKRCKAAGFDNISIDLIYGIPGQTPESFRKDIEQAVSLDVTHISSYHLTYEEGTPVWSMLERDEITPIDEESSVEMYSILCKTLKENGYIHYEISNFAKEGFMSRHNSSYWDGTPYIGTGAGAHSFNGESRQWNPDNLHSYIDGIEAGKPSFEEEYLSIENRYNEAIMLGLRCSKGVCLNTIKERFGELFHNKFLKDTQTFTDRGLLIKDADRIRFTEHGLFISDNIVSSLFIVE